ncbi:MAG TPA: PepSY domain-containing protein [Burkholderiales bacterium]|jgi:uncharacterized membrane protein YkoI|nr:PepSY domain-containing protein [Burkholderiales bacterium]
MTRLQSGRAAVLALAAAAACAPLTGAADEGHAIARRLHEAGEIRSLEEISARARAAKAGEILETELERSDGRYVYEMEILDAQGQVWELKLDAKTGELLRMEIDD